jgi:hypothetical protein
MVLHDHTGRSSWLCHLNHPTHRSECPMQHALAVRDRIFANSDLHDRGWFARHVLPGIRSPAGRSPRRRRCCVSKPTSLCCRRPPPCSRPRLRLVDNRLLFCGRPPPSTRLQHPFSISSSSRSGRPPPAYGRRPPLCTRPPPTGTRPPPRLHVSTRWRRTLDSFRESTSRRKFLLRLHEHGRN